MHTRKLILTATAALALGGLAGCKTNADTTSGADAHDAAPAANDTTTGEPGDVVTGTSMTRFEGVETHYAECQNRWGDRYEVQVPAAQEYQLHQGQPCPPGLHHLLPSPQEAQQLIDTPLPYRGGNANDHNPACGEWATVDKAEARRLAVQCPPLTAGDLR